MILAELKKHLSAVGIYGEDAVYSGYELTVAAEEIERLYAMMDEGIRERFLASAAGEGLRVYEELYGPARTDLTTERRRERLRERLRLGQDDFTLSGLYRALDSFGLRYTVSEFPRYYRLNILAQEDYSKAEQALIRQEIAKFVPAHLEVQTVFHTATWDELDDCNSTFAQLDGDSLTWRQIDELQSSSLKRKGS